MVTLYVSNNGPCHPCQEAEEAISRWEKEGKLKHPVKIKPIPSDPTFESFVRLRLGGRWGYPLLHDEESQQLVLGFPSTQFEQMLCT